MDRFDLDFERLDLPVLCPAGERVQETRQGPTCRCRLEGAMTGEPSLITAAHDPSSLAAYCMGTPSNISGYVVCPTWKAGRDLERERADVMAMTAPVGESRTHGMDDLMEISERAMEGHPEAADDLRREIMERKRELGLALGSG